MNKNFTLRSSFCTLIVLSLCLCMSVVLGCSARGQATDPGAWGYECKVTYDSLGGIVNAREVRTTYYQKNSYIFMPSGSSNMLVDPVRDGYILAGWYTAKSEVADNSVEEYRFNAQDRWDFYTDRVQGDMTLYARWLPRGKLNYIDVATGEVLFAKNITADSPIQPLSSSILALQTPEGTSFEGYYDDETCTKSYDFTSITDVDPAPSESKLYERLFYMFPEYLEEWDFVKPLDGKEVDSESDTSWRFLNELGYRLKTTEETAINVLADAKDALIEEYIQNYLIGTANKVVYLKFEKTEP